MQFSLNFVKITAYARPGQKAERAPLQNLIWGTPKKYFGNLDRKAEDTVKWEINLT